MHFSLILLRHLTLYRIMNSCLSFGKLESLASYGIGLEHIFPNREHYVVVENAKSSLLPVVSGVPQGSILGPLLFLIYIDDLPVHIVHSESYLFADDVKLFKSICDSNSLQQMSVHLSSLNDWCKTWKLKLNCRKCAHLRFSFSRKSKELCEPAMYSVGSSCSYCH